MMAELSVMDSGNPIRRRFVLRLGLVFGILASTGVLWGLPSGYSVRNTGWYRQFMYYGLFAHTTRITTRTAAAGWRPQSQIQVHPVRLMLTTLLNATAAAASVAWYRHMSRVFIYSDRCQNCGYDLHGLSASGDCPECGAPFQQFRS